MKASELLISVPLAAATVFFGLSCFMMSGIGICGGPSLSWGLFLFSCGGGVVCSGLFALLYPRVWGAGAFIFALSAALFLLATVVVQDWMRAMAIGSCIASAAVAAFLTHRAMFPEHRG
jgi:hypothetical protein